MIEDGLLFLQAIGIIIAVVLLFILFGAILAVCTDDEYFEEDAFDYDAWKEREK